MVNISRVGPNGKCIEKRTVIFISKSLEYKVAVELKKKKISVTSVSFWEEGYLVSKKKTKKQWSGLRAKQTRDNKA